MVIPMNSETRRPFGHITLCRIAVAGIVAALLLCAGVSAGPAETPTVTECSLSDETDDGLFAPLFRFFASLFSSSAEDAPSPGNAVPLPVADTTPDATPAPAVPTPEMTTDSTPDAEPTATVAGESTPSRTVTGGIMVETVPSGARVTLDGKETGKKTPTLFAGLREGTHTIGVSSSITGSSGSEAVWVYPGAIAPVSFELSSSIPETTVRVESGTGVPVVFALNGKLPEVTTPADVTVSTTDSFVAVTSDEGYQTFPLEYQQGNGSFILTPAACGDCTIRVTSDPEGALIFIDGRQTDETTPADISGVSPGRHRIVCSLPGYYPEDRVLAVNDHSGIPDAEVSFTLEPYANGGITVSSDPAGAKLYLYGRYTGLSTPATISDLPIGTYWVGLSTGFETINREVIVLPDTVTEYEFGFDE